MPKKAPPGLLYGGGAPDSFTQLAARSHNLPVPDQFHLLDHADIVGHHIIQQRVGDKGAFRWHDIPLYQNGSFGLPLHPAYRKESGPGFRYLENSLKLNLKRKDTHGETECNVSEEDGGKICTSACFQGAWASLDLGCVNKPPGAGDVDGRGHTKESLVSRQIESDGSMIEPDESSELLELGLTCDEVFQRVRRPRRTMCTIASSCANRQTCTEDITTPHCKFATLVRVSCRVVFASRTVRGPHIVCTGRGPALCILFLMVLTLCGSCARN